MGLWVTFAAAVELVTYATDTDRLDVLRRSARWHGWSALQVIGTQEGFNAHGLVDKLRALRRYVRGRPDDSLLAFVDAYDVIVNHAPFHLEATFLASGKRVLVSSERGCCVDKATALAYGTACHPTWPFRPSEGRRWLNSGVLIGYARDLRRLLRMAWREYRRHPAVYRAQTDQQLLCFLLSDGATLWVREAVGIDHASAVALSTYDMDLYTELTFDADGRVVFDRNQNRTVPTFVHFNGPPEMKAAQMGFAAERFPLWNEA
jgi:hypothetical protein